jgi:hypothetical protein
MHVLFVSAYWSFHPVESGCRKEGNTDSFNCFGKYNIYIYNFVVRNVEYLRAEPTFYRVSATFCCSASVLVQRSGCTAYSDNMHVDTRPHVSSHFCAALHSSDIM